MAISKDITIKILGNQSQLNESIYVYEKDNGVVFNFTLMEYKYKYDKDPDNVLNSNASDILKAYTTIVNPLGQELEQLNGEVIDDVVKFTLDKTYTDQLTEIGIYKLQIHIKCTHAEFSIPPITFEVLERLKGKSIADSAQVDITELQNNVAQIDVVDGILNVVWQRGDIISSTKLNQMTAAINNNTTTNKSQDNRITLVENELTQVRQVYVNVEGSHISTDSSVGYLKDVEILGNTIQDASNLADIRSVGDKVEGQELYEIPVVSCGKNLFNIIEEPFKNNGNINLISYDINSIVASLNENNNWSYIKVPLTNLKPNTDYVFSYTVSANRYARVYQENTAIDNMISGTDTTKRKFNTGNYTDLSIRFFITTDNGENGEVTFSNIQLEEGTVATPYEPYKEDKLTILSPTPLEKVGDVRDRIICKDGVWGVEKNIVTKTFNSSEGMVKGELTNVFRYNIQLDSVKLGNLCISNKYTYVNNYSLDEEHFYIGSDGKLYVFVNKTNSNGFPFIIKYATNAPQFIPLPHDQQVKLRTFANKTNISFGCEIEGTIKAQVPKSLGATVNTHTEQINNLNKELDRVKKLEESTVSTVETESDFTTVEATSNGYFEDVKLEGKTLVNLMPNPLSTSHFAVLYASISDNVISFTANGTSRNLAMKMDSLNLKPSTKYTMIVEIVKNTVVSSGKAFHFVSNGIGRGDAYLTVIGSQSFVEVGEVGTRIIPMITREEGNYSTSLMGFVPIGATSGEISFKICLLEGDHTQNPPSYFEGLKSVGQDVDEIVVSSRGKNLFDGVFEDGDINSANGNDEINATRKRSRYLKVFDSEISFSEIPMRLCWYDKDKKFIKFENTKKTYIKPNNAMYIRFSISNDVNNIMIVQDSTPASYEPYQSDKKRLLFYNDETQTWEKPILREWDSIKKHSNGKCYYHQRSGEVVLDGSEDWIIDNDATKETSLHFRLNGASYNLKPANNNYSSVEFICDKFTSRSADFVWCVNTQNPNGVYEGIAINTSCFICVRVLKSKLSTQDIQGFKQWLQANNVTVVYQLAQEKVYECTNIDLITYANETNYIVESGAIVPKTALKVHNNISNVVRELQQKVSTLEQNESKFMQILRDLINK